MAQDDGSSRGGVLLELPAADATALVQLIRDRKLDARAVILDACASDGDRSVSVLAIEPGLGALLARDEVREFILERPGAGLALMAHLARRARIVERERSELSRARHLLEALGWLSTDYSVGEVCDLNAHRRRRRVTRG
jgi:CRP-like cAMP-binding protein